MPPPWRPPADTRLGKIWPDLSDREANVKRSATEWRLLFESLRLTNDVKAAERRAALEGDAVEKLQASLKESHELEWNLLVELEGSERREKEQRETISWLKTTVAEHRKEIANLKEQKEKSEKRAEGINKKLKERLEKSEKLCDDIKGKVETATQKLSEAERETEEERKRFGEQVDTLHARLCDTSIENEELKQKNRDLARKLAAALSMTAQKKAERSSVEGMQDQDNEIQEESSAEDESQEDDHGSDSDGAEDDSDDGLYKPVESFARRMTTQSRTGCGEQSRVCTRQQTQTGKTNAHATGRRPPTRQKAFAKPGVTRKSYNLKRLCSDPQAANNAEAQSASKDLRNQDTSAIQPFFVVPEAVVPQTHSTKKRKLTAKSRSTATSSVLLGNSDAMEEDGLYQAKSQKGKEKQWQASTK